MWLSFSPLSCGSRLPLARGYRFLFPPPLPCGSPDSEQRRRCFPLQPARSTMRCIRRCTQYASLTFRIAILFAHSSSVVSAACTYSTSYHSTVLLLYPQSDLIFTSFGSLHASPLTTLVTKARSSQTLSSIRGPSKGTAGLHQPRTSGQRQSGSVRNSKAVIEKAAAKTNFRYHSPLLGHPCPLGSGPSEAFSNPRYSHTHTHTHTHRSPQPQQKL